MKQANKPDDKAGKTMEDAANQLAEAVEYTMKNYWFPSFSEFSKRLNTALKDYKQSFKPQPSVETEIKPEEINGDWTEARLMFHKLWTKHVGNGGYNKKDWQKAEQLLFPTPPKSLQAIKDEVAMQISGYSKKWKDISLTNRGKVVDKVAIAYASSLSAQGEKEGESRGGGWISPEYIQ